MNTVKKLSPAQARALVAAIRKSQKKPKAK